jgi:hypothetical protein
METESLHGIKDIHSVELEIVQDIACIQGTAYKYAFIYVVVSALVNSNFTRKATIRWKEITAYPH